jgi:taurine---2-oxoglutarate transaminase
VKAIQDQAALLATVAPAHANLARGEAAKRILSKAGGQFGKVFFTNGGADANENAMRMARITTGRDKILTQYRSYHGNTGAAVVATGDWRRVPNEFARGHVHFFGPFAYRSEFWSETPEQECERALHHLERIIQAEGANSIAAILIEGIPGTAGVLVPPPGYLTGVRDLADRHGILVILDEVMSGFGRTGDWFAHQNATVNPDGVVPDLITFAKGVNSGYVPVGGVIISESIANEFEDQVFPGGLTYSGHPLAMASIVASIDAMEDEKILENAARIGEKVLGPGLRELASKHEMIGEVRGLGVFWALDLVQDAATREPVAPATIGLLKAELMARGLLPFAADNRIHVVPPCTVTDADVKKALKIYDEAFTVVEAV